MKCRGKNARVLLRPNGVDYAVQHDVFVKELYRSAVTGVNGISTLCLNALYPAAQIVSVEPLPGNIEMLREMIALNGLLESVTVIPQAVGVQDGTAVLNISPDPTANSLVPRNRGDKPLEVAQIAMAPLMRQMQWPRIDVLKIDIEGYEKTLFRENTEWLSKTRFIVGEGHGHVGYDFGAVERDLTMYGFKLTHEYQDPHYEILSSVRNAPEPHILDAAASAESGLESGLESGPRLRPVKLNRSQHGRYLSLPQPDSARPSSLVFRQRRRWS